MRAALFVVLAGCHPTAEVEDPVDTGVPDPAAEALTACLDEFAQTTTELPAELAVIESELAFDGRTPWVTWQEYNPSTRETFTWLQRLGCDLVPQGERIELTIGETQTAGAAIAGRAGGVAVIWPARVASGFPRPLALAVVNDGSLVPASPPTFALGAAGTDVDVEAWGDGFIVAAGVERNGAFAVELFPLSVSGVVGPVLASLPSPFKVEMPNENGALGTDGSTIYVTWTTDSDGTDYQRHRAVVAADGTVVSLESTPKSDDPPPAEEYASGFGRVMRLTGGSDSLESWLDDLSGTERFVDDSPHFASVAVAPSAAWLTVLDWGRGQTRVARLGADLSDEHVVGFADGFGASDTVALDDRHLIVVDTGNPGFPSPVLLTSWRVED